MRLDRALVARGLARSRASAHTLVTGGSVSVDGSVVTKASAEVNEKGIILLKEGDVYVSRAARKLVGALEAFGPAGFEVSGRRCLDAGASTGGFTQVLLQRKASHVLALDVGHGQMAKEIRDDPRVTVREEVNVRNLPPPQKGEGVGLLVADLSFISLTLVVGALAPWVDPDGDILLLVKPQFETGPGRFKGGIVKDRLVRARAVESVAKSVAGEGIDILGVRRSVVPGMGGNVEFFLWGAKTWQAKGDVPRPRPLRGQALGQTIAREVCRHS